MAVHGQSNISHVPNTIAGWKTLASILATAGVTRVGIEATGGYERGVMAHLRSQGVAATLL